MGAFFNAGGVFMIVVLAFGLVTFIFNVLQLMKGKEANFFGLIAGLLCATFLFGVCGTGMGFYHAWTALGSLAKPPTASTLLQVTGIAWTPTAFAALLSAINAILLGIAHYLARR